MWRMNSLEFDSAGKLNEFVESDQFIQYVDKLKPLTITILTDNGVSGKLEQPWLYGEERFSGLYWNNTYNVPNTKAESDPSPAQQTELEQLKQIEDLINRRLNRE